MNTGLCSERRIFSGVKSAKWKPLLPLIRKFPRCNIGTTTPFDTFRVSLETFRSQTSGGEGRQRDNTRNILTAGIGSRSDYRNPTPASTPQRTFLLRRGLPLCFSFSLSWQRPRFLPKNVCFPSMLQGAAGKRLSWGGFCFPASLEVRRDHMIEFRPMKCGKGDAHHFQRSTVKER